MMTPGNSAVQPLPRPSCTIVTDSSACLGRRSAETLGVRVLPIELFVGGVEVAGDDDAAARIVDAALARGEPVKSSAPSVSAYLSAIEDAPTEDVIVLTPAREFTAMTANAVLAATLTDKRVHVIDTRTASGPQGLIAARCARMARDGAPVDEVVTAAATATGHAELVAALAHLDVLRASGRIEAGALAFAEHLGVRPVFRLHDGRVERLGLPTSEEAALRRIRTEAFRLGFRPGCDAMLLHLGSLELAERLGRQLGCEAPISTFSPAIAAHAGRELVGLAWLGEGPRSGHDASG
ncbi:MAG: DegV family protein [Candidatus Velamenicoccus archaeovorus]